MSVKRDIDYPLTAAGAGEPGTRTLMLAIGALVAAIMLSFASFAGTAGAEPVQLSGFSIGSFNSDLTSSTAAGAHPYEFTTRFDFSTVVDGNGTTVPAENARNLSFDLPAGIVGNAHTLPQCPQERMDELGNCPVDTQVGVAYLKVQWIGGVSEKVSAVYNLVPPPGTPAQFGIIVVAAIAHVNFHVRTGADYGVTATVNGINTAAALYGSTLSIWGVPADPGHDALRFEPRFNNPGVGGEGVTAIPYPDLAKPFLSNPTSCTGPLATSMTATTWQNPGVKVAASSQMPGMTECEAVPFTPTVAIAPESSSTDSPTGLNVDVHVPQNENPTGLAEADLKDATVTLPQGMTVNPSSANGLAACSPAQIELHGPAPAACPDASKIGSVEIDTPLLDHPLKGGVYLATQGENPFGSLLALYIAVNDPQSGIVIKLAGKVTPDPVTGQLTTTFDENPQLPFEDLKLHLSSGDRAALATPTVCGAYSSQASLTPWSAPQSAVVLPSAFELTSAVHGSPCAAPGFAPSFAAGTVGSQAGAFSPFSMTLSRNDGEQRLGAVSIKMPQGVEGMLARVPLCAEAQASTGTCSPASQIGHVTVTAGVGGEPVTLPAAGRPQDPVYLTGPYGGAPFGLSIVVPAEAGPFNLDENGRPVVVRSKIEVDPHTGQVSVLSDPLPSMLQGIPTDLRAVNVVIDREGFTFAPTDCTPAAVTGTIASTTGAAAAVSTAYQAANCARLAFKPKFSASTAAKSSRAGGASLDVKLLPPAQGPVLGSSARGQEANIARVKVDLPKQLPSRLTTLQKACTAAQFAANPGGCPAASVVGHAIVRTPLLSGPLQGPAYFVSHGGEAFPQLVIVLQGEGVTIDLAGDTFINKKGITSSTFAAVPDVPISSFELSLPQGKYSALAANLPKSANGSFCGQKLALPTEFVAQNGAVIHQSTPLGISGCPKAKTTKRAKQLASALGACKKRAKAKRAACDRAAQNKYGTKKTTTTK